MNFIMRMTELYAVHTEKHSQIGHQAGSPRQNNQDLTLCDCRMAHNQGEQLTKLNLGLLVNRQQEATMEARIPINGKLCIFQMNQDMPKKKEMKHPVLKYPMLFPTRNQSLPS